MKAQTMDEKYVRIAEVTENIVNVNQMIDLHRKTTKNQSMAKQYICQRDEFIAELQKIFESLNLTVTLSAAA